MFLATGTIISEIYLNLFLRNGVSYGEHWFQCQARSVAGGFLSLLVVLRF